MILTDASVKVNCKIKKKNPFETVTELKRGFLKLNSSSVGFLIIWVVIKVYQALNHPYIPLPITPRLISV